MIHGKMMSRIAKPVPCPKLAAMSRAMKIQRTKMAMSQEESEERDPANRLQASMIQKK